MSKKDVLIICSVFTITGIGIYTIAKQTRKTSVTTTQEARIVAEKEFKKSVQNSSVQILKIEQLDRKNPHGEGWLIYHSAQVHKNKPLFISTDGSMEYVEDQNFKSSDREPSSIKKEILIK